MIKKLQKRGEGVLLEDIDSKLDLVLEGQVALAKRMDSLEIKVDNLILRVDGLEKRIINLEKEVNYKFEAVFDQLHIIKNELKQKISQDEFLMLEKRVMMIEKKLTEKK